MQTLEGLRTSLRRLARSPGFALTSILALGLGIGVLGVVFGLLDSTLLRPLPFAEPDRLVAVWDRFPQLGLPKFPLTQAELGDLRRKTETFAGMAAYRFPIEKNLTGVEQPSVLSGAEVSSDFFSLLGVEPLVGRFFHPDESEPGNDAVVVLGEQFFASRFGRDPKVIGQRLELDDRLYTVIGVVADGIRFPGRGQFVVPMVLDPALATDRGSHSMNAVARLARGVSLDQARSAVEATARHFATDFPNYYPANSGWTLGLVPLRDELVGDVRRILLLLLAAAALVLLLTCANLAHLLLVRAEGRQAEIGVRVSLGASQADVRRQFLSESLIVSLAGGALALLLAGPCLDLIRVFRPTSLPNLDLVHVDVRMIGLSFALAVLIGVAFSWLPQRAEKLELARILIGGTGRTTADRRRRGVRFWLVAAEVAISFVILAATALLLRSFLNVVRVDPGFRSDGVATCKLSPSPKSYESQGQVTALYRRLIERMRALPGVDSAGAVINLPVVDPNYDWSFEIEGRPVPPGQPGPTGDYQVVVPDYFATLGIRVLRGRGFDAQDAESGPPVVVINEAMARRYWPNADPIGQRLRLGGTPSPTWATIIGVVGDIRHQGLDAEPRPENYFAQPQFQTVGGAVFRAFTLVAHAATDATALVGAIERAVREIDPNLPIQRSASLDSELRDSMSGRRFSLWLFVALTLLALFLAALGTYGVISYSLAQRTREVAIRLALGTTRGDVWRLLLAQALRPVALGIALGLAATLAFGRLLRSQLYGIAATDPATLAAVVVCLASVSVVAISIPVWRAVRVKSLALRSE